MIVGAVAGDERSVQTAFTYPVAETLSSSGRWKRHSDDVSVYRLRDLIDATTIFLTEGEKAADRLWALGLPATCGPNGASGIGCPPLASHLSRHGGLLRNERGASPAAKTIIHVKDRLCME